MYTRLRPIASGLRGQTKASVHKNTRSMQEQFYFDAKAEVNIVSVS